MSKVIEIADETAALVARHSAATGMSDAELVDQWARAAENGLEEFRAAVHIGLEAAEQGDVSDMTVEQVFDEALAEYDRQNGSAPEAS